MRYRFLRQTLIFLLLTLGSQSVTLTPSAVAEKNGAEESVLLAQGQSELLRSGRELYEAGKFAQAASVWQRAEQTATEPLQKAIALSNLALVWQQLGQWQKAEFAIASSLKIVRTQPASKEQLEVLAQALNTQGGLQFSLGKTELALGTWQEATASYDQAGDRNGTIRGLLNQTQALRSLGFYRRSLKILGEVSQSLRSQPDSLLKANQLRSLGDSLLATGDLEKSQLALSQSLEISKRLGSGADNVDTLLSLGNLARSQKNIKSALSFYQQATGDASSITNLQAQLNQLSLLVETNDMAAAQVLSPQIQSHLSKLTPSRAAVYARINFAESLTKLKGNPQEVAQILSVAVQQAKELQDIRATSYALGSLGGLYEQTKQLNYAQDLTQQALIIAQSINADDIAYRWQWQLGRLFKAQGNTESAIAAYSEAVNHLKDLRSDLVAIDPGVQFSFRESVEPVYRDLVSLLLQSEPTIDQSKLKLAQDTIESLQLAELVNFFRADCLDAKPVEIAKIDRQAAVIYPIILSDRLEVILSIPEQPLRHYATRISQTQVDNLLSGFRSDLRDPSSLDYLPASRKLYDWLIRPAEADLTKHNVKTLVFVLDGSLRNVPMAASSDGKQFLIEKYNLALTPGLQLLNPRPLSRQSITALTAGLTEARQGFSALPNVTSELKEIKSQVPSKELINQSFTGANFRQAIEGSAYPVIHMATHGQFSSNADDTFLLTWDGRIDIEQLNQLIQTSSQDSKSVVELLILSACQTALGDKRAALGMAGMAVRAGARSTIASLWSVNDEATAAFMTEFYRGLVTTKITKAEVTRQAQLALIKTSNYKHPFFWAPFILLGNWL